MLQGRLAGGPPSDSLGAIVHCPAASSETPMTEGPRVRADAATAGLSLVGAMIAGAGAGYGLGSLVGLAIPLGLIGLFAGLVAGLVLVYARFRRL